MILCAFILCLCCPMYRYRLLRRADHWSKESYRLCKKDYETEEEARAQQRAVNRTQGIDDFVCVYSVFVLSCVCSGFYEGLITRPRSPTVCVKKITKLKKRPGPNKGL
jgi:hypothetical protein